MFGHSLQLLRMQQYLWGPFLGCPLGELLYGCVFAIMLFQDIGLPGMLTRLFCCCGILHNLWLIGVFSCTGWLRYRGKQGSALIACAAQQWLHMLGP